MLIQTRASLISAGTEKMLVEFSRANLVQKARQQPDKVAQMSQLWQKCEDQFREQAGPRGVGVSPAIRRRDAFDTPAGAKAAG